MFKPPRPKVIIILFCFLLAGPAVAFSNENVEQGVAALKQERYQTAIKAFLQARESGINTDQLNYNLGIAYYKNGQYAQAHVEFRKVTSASSLYSMALFNLGLIAIKQDRPKDARHLFQQVESIDNGSKAGQLAVVMLNRLNEEQATSPWFNKGFGLLLIELGSEDKSISPEEDGGAVLQQQNQYLDLLAFTSINILPRKLDALSAQLSFFGMHNLQASEYDLVFATVDLQKGYGALSLENELSVGTTAMQLGADPYSVNYHISHQSEKQLLVNTKAKLQYTFYVHTSLSSNYETLDGIQHRLKAQLEYSLSQHKISYGYEFESNDREDTVSSLGYRSYSPLRHKAWLDLMFYRNRKISPGLKLEYRESHYPSIEKSSGDDRDDQRYRAQIKFAYTVSKTLAVNLDYIYTLNQSNTTGYDYRRNEVVLGVEYLF